MSADGNTNEWQFPFSTAIVHLIGKIWEIYKWVEGYSFRLMVMQSFVLCCCWCWIVKQRKIYVYRVFWMCRWSHHASNWFKSKIKTHIIPIVYTYFLNLYTHSTLGHRIPDVPVPLFGVYPASKYALTAMVQTIRQELQFHQANIKVTVRNTSFIGAEICFFFDMLWKQNHK